MASGDSSNGPSAGDSRFERVARNAGWLAGGELASRAIGLVTVLYLARALGPDNFGAIGVASALLGFLTVMARLGTAPQAIRSVARNASTIPEVFATITGLRIVATVSVVLVVALASTPIARSLGIPAALLLVYLATLPGAVVVPQWAFRGLDRMYVPAFSEFLQRAMMLVLLVGFLGSGPDALYRVPVFEAVVGLTVGAAVIFVLRHECGSLQVRFDWKAWPPILSEGGKIGFARVLDRIYQDGDVILLASLAGTSAAALFVVGHKIALTVALGTSILQQSAFPTTLRIAAEDPRAAVAYQATLLRYMQLLLALPVCLGIVAAGDIIGWLYGNAYAEAAAVLRVSLLVTPLVVVSGSLRGLLIAAAGSRGLAAGAGIAVVVHVALAILLIPDHGATGAAAACAIGEVCGAVWLIWEVRRFIGVLPLATAQLAPWVAAIFAAVVYVIVASALGASWGPVLAAVMATVCFALVATGLGALRVEDLRRLRSLVAS